MRSSMRILLLMLSVVIFVEGRGTPGRRLQHFEDGTRYENSMVVDYRTRRPFSYLANEVNCVKYTVKAKEGDDGEHFPLLSYAQTEDQMAEFLDSGSLKFIEGSSCNETACSKEFLVPEQEGGKNPFYVTVVNGRSNSPAFRPDFRNALNVEVVVEGCDGDHGSTRSGANTGALAIVLPIVGVIIICVICAAFTYRNRQKFASEDGRFSPGSSRRAPLANPGSGSLAMSGGSPQVRTVEEPVPGPNYFPPPRENVVREEPPAGPSQVFNNSMWGRLFSKQGSVKLRTMGSVVGMKSPEPEEFAPAAEPVPEESDADSDDQEDVHQGTRVGPEEESQKPKESKVFVNNLFTRMQSGLQRSFQSFKSFGDRSGSTGVKLKSLNSAAKQMKRKEAGSAAIRENAVEEGGPVSFTLPETPKREEPQDEKNMGVPGAEHLSDSSDDEEASPFERNAVQNSAANRIRGQ